MQFRLDYTVRELSLNLRARQEVQLAALRRGPSAGNILSAGASRGRDRSSSRAHPDCAEGIPHACRRSQAESSKSIQPLPPDRFLWEGPLPIS
jgi:hypothetical protein